MRRLLAKASGLFILGIFAGSFIATPPVAVDTETRALTQIQSVYPYLNAVSESQIATPDTIKVVASEASIDARFVGMLSHIKWLISGDAVTDKDNEIVRINKQIYSFMDDVSEDFDDLREDINDDDSSSSTLTNPVFEGEIGSNIPLGPHYISGDGDDEGIVIDASGNVQLTAGLRDTSGDVGTSGYILLSTGSGTNWVATSTLGLTASATPLSNDDVIPDYVASAGQTDEYCLTYEMTGDTWEWQTCGSGSSSFATSSIDTSLKLANIITDETGSGALVFAGSPTLTGTLLANSANFNGDVGVGTTTPSAKLAVAGTAATYGAELVTNGTFTGNANGWTLQSGCSVYNSNHVVVTYDATCQGDSGYPALSTTFSSVSGTSYKVTFTLSGVSGDQVNYYLDNSDNASIPVGNGTYTFYFTSSYTGAETITFDLWNYNDDATYTIDDISVQAITSAVGSTLAVTDMTGKNLLSLGGQFLHNLFIGSDAGAANTTGFANTFLGDSAGITNTTGRNNTFIGQRAGYSNISGVENIFIGTSAGYSNTSGNSNFFAGNSSGHSNTTGFQNVFIGNDSGYSNQTGYYNIFLGSSAGYSNTTGFSNTFIGNSSGVSNTSGTENTFIGTLAGSSNTAGIQNVFNGISAGYANTAGSGNIFVGSAAGDNNTSGNYNITIGYAVDQVSATASNRLNIGNLIFGTGLDGTGTTLSSGNIGIGTTSPNAKLTVHGDINFSQAGGVLQFGGTRYVYASTTNDSIVFGELAGNSLTSATTFNIAFGYEAGRNMSNSNADFMTLLGYQAGYQNTGDHTSIVGFGAGYQNSGDYNAIMGPSAGLANTGDYNNLIGAFAGRNSTGGFNNFIGHSVGFQNTGNYNNVIGYYAGYNNTGSNNDMMGYQAGRYLLASSSVVIGAEALYGSHATNFVAGHNVAIGYRAGYTADDGAGANILIGYQAADNITTGNNNIIIGYNIDALSATADNRLNIGNLIFGTGLDGTGTTLSSGNIGIGTTTPAQKLQVVGNIRVGTTGSNGCLEDFGGGLISGTCSSDEDLKENIEPIEKEGRSYAESLAALTPVTYNWNEEAAELYSKDMTAENLGLIAQDVETEFPELVSLNDEGYRQVDFRALPFYMIQALKEIWEKVTGHDDRLDELEQENEYLKERLEVIEDELDIDAPTEPVAPEPFVEEIVDESETEALVEEEVVPVEFEPVSIETETTLVPGESL